MLKFPNFLLTEYKTFSSEIVENIVFLYFYLHEEQSISGFNEFEPRLKSKKTVSIERRLKSRNINTILSETNHI